MHTCTVYICIMKKNIFVLYIKAKIWLLEYLQHMTTEGIRLASH